jgi:hypothetical protein
MSDRQAARRVPGTNGARITTVFDLGDREWERLMRMVFGVLGLLLVLVIVGLVAKTQLRALQAPAVAEAGAAASMPVLGGTPTQQSQQIQKNVQDDLNKIMQQAPARLEPAQ